MERVNEELLHRTEVFLKSFLVANLVTTSKAPVTTSFLLLLVRHLLLVAMHLLLVAMPVAPGSDARCSW